MRKLLNTKKTNRSIPYNGDTRKKDRASPRGNANGLARSPSLPQWLKQENSTTQIMRKLLNTKKTNRSIPYNGDTRKQDILSPRGNPNGQWISWQSPSPPI